MDSLIPEVSAKRTKVVVVIDDEIDNVELTVLLLESAGHSAFGATDGLSGIDLVDAHDADIVVLDFVLPGLKGDEVGRRLRARHPSNGLRIIMCSGTAETTIRPTFADYDAFLTKPVDGHRLLELVDDL